MCEKVAVFVNFREYVQTDAPLNLTSRLPLTQVVLNGLVLRLAKLSDIHFQEVACETMRMSVLSALGGGG